MVLNNFLSAPFYPLANPPPITNCCTCVLQKRLRTLIVVHHVDELRQQDAHILAHSFSQLQCNLAQRPNRVVADRDVFRIQVLSQNRNKLVDERLQVDVAGLGQVAKQRKRTLTHFVRGVLQNRNDLKIKISEETIGKMFESFFHFKFELLRNPKLFFRSTNTYVS